MLKIGITGGIGSGKSFVSDIFRVWGVPVYNADKEAKRLMNHDRDLKTALKALLGQEAYYKNGRLNRKWVASKIFSDKTLLKKMNAVVHPAVRNDFEHWAELQQAPYVLEESAIIFEAGLEKFFDAVILVMADKNTRIQRVMKRDKMTKEEVKARMAHQSSDKVKKARADFIILNDGTKALLKQVIETHEAILKLK